MKAEAEAAFPAEEAGAEAWGGRALAGSLVSGRPSSGKWPGKSQEPSQRGFCLFEGGGLCQGPGGDTGLLHRSFKGRKCGQRGGQVRGYCTGPSGEVIKAPVATTRGISGGREKCAPVRSADLDDPLSS